MENSNREIMAVGDGQYLESRRLEIQAVRDGCYNLTIKTPDYAALNNPTGCNLESLQTLRPGGQLELTDAKGFPLRFFADERLLVVDYQGDIAENPQRRFCGVFLFPDYQALLGRLES